MEQNPVKRSLRTKLRAKRQAISHSEQIEKSKALVPILEKMPEFIKSQHIAFYSAVENEIDPEYLLTAAQRLGKKCYLPVLHPLKAELWFVHYKIGDKLTQNRFKILEPKLDAKKIIPAWSLDLVLVPMLAFDSKGRRLGTGGGYYDRTFAFTKTKSRPKLPRLIGLAYDFQEVSSLPWDDWDIQLTGIVTNKGYLEGKLRSL